MHLGLMQVQGTMKVFDLIGMARMRTHTQIASSCACMHGIATLEKLL